MAFINRIRIPIKLMRPQLTEESEKFTKANGAIKTLSVVIKKEYEGETDHWPEKMHDRLKIALAHDTVNIEGERYIGGISATGDYNIEWPDFLDYPFGKAKFKVNATPFNASNSNCASCDDYSQVVCEDDDIGLIGEDESQSVPVTDNDAICCYPFEISIVSFNADLIDSPVVNGNNIDIHTKTGLTSADNVVLATYRVTCESGLYDEADIIADIDGTVEPTCNQPSFLDAGLGADGPGTAAPNWDEPVPAPVGYNYALYLLPDTVTPIDSGTTTATSVLYNPLAPGDYRFILIADCGDGELASPLTVDFTIPEAEVGCGNYQLRVTAHPLSQSATYLDCNGNYQTVIFTSTNVRLICAAQTTPGNPISIVRSHPASSQLLYIDEC